MVIVAAVAAVGAVVRALARLGDGGGGGDALVREGGAVLRLGALEGSDVAEEVGVLEREEEGGWRETRKDEEQGGNGVQARNLSLFTGEEGRGGGGVRGGLFHRTDETSF